MSLADKRNYGIDLLRIVSMLMVLILHILGAGGILDGTEKLSLNYELAWLLETSAYGAVNCYALISGYVGYKAKYRYTNLAVLWLQVLLYSVGFTVAFALFFPGTVHVMDVLRSFFPVLSNYGWYFTCYFALFFLMPPLNHLINTMSEKSLKILCGSILGGSFLSTVAGGNIFQLSDGYSVIWLAALYLLGGCLGRFGWFKGVKKGYLGLIYGGCVIASWGAKYLLETQDCPWIKEFTYPDMLIRYTSPTILIGAVALLLCFAQINLPKLLRNVIKFLAPAAFGVYIIHMHPQLWNRIIVGQYVEYAGESPWMMIVKVLATAVVLYVLLSVVDLIRHYSFRLLKIKDRLSHRETRIREEEEEERA